MLGVLMLDRYHLVFLILINPKQQINDAHKSMLDTKYYDNMSSKYKKYLNVSKK